LRSGGWLTNKALGVDKGCSQAEVGGCEYRSEEEFLAARRPSRDGGGGFGAWMIAASDAAMVRLAVGKVKAAMWNNSRNRRTKSAYRLILSFLAVFPLHSEATPLRSLKIQALGNCRQLTCLSQGLANCGQELIIIGRLLKEGYCSGFQRTLIIVSRTSGGKHDDGDCHKIC
jgi:hypothetical protein